MIDSWRCSARLPDASTNSDGTEEEKKKNPISVFLINEKSLGFHQPINRRPHKSCSRVNSHNKHRLMLGVCLSIQILNLAFIHRNIVEDSSEISIH